jgi:sterol desaturase/sphingolipid hydroxylase (fatty acid hydroxylase superfamily)
VLYIAVNGSFLLIERFELFEEYKLSRKPIQVPTVELIRRTWAEAGFGQIVAGPLIVYFGYPLFTATFGMPALDAPLPGLWDMWYQYALAHLFNDVGFYFSHRFVHSKSLYPLIHKQHHTYTGTIGFAAEFAHPVETIVSNQLPTVGGCIFFGRHPLVFLMWVGARLQQTYEGHSGYCFAGSALHTIGLTNAETAAYHDYHHTGNRGNFGAMWLDWLFGTMDAWVKLGGLDGYVADCKKNRKTAPASA